MLNDEITARRVAKAAGITLDQAHRALAAMPEPPSGGPNYVRRMGYIRETCMIFGDKVAHLTDAELERRFCKPGTRLGRIVQYAKDADARTQLNTPDR